jgi:putative proteasome-type protease
MTYCCGILVREGLVMIADTRTNAGLDDISTFRKMHVFAEPGERLITVMSAGNLSITQSVLNFATEGLENPDTKEIETLSSVPSMFRAAQFIGRCIRKTFDAEGDAMEQAGVSFKITLLLGGQIKGDRLRLFMIYSAGNFIECTQDAPYLQIGEHKYGKPILDRAVNYETGIHDALKIGLISMDSTMRSNLGVGLPIDILVQRRDTQRAEMVRRIDERDEYFHNLRESWSSALRAAHIAIPKPPYWE